MLEQINNIREKSQNELNALTGTEKLSEWYQRYLGRKGDLTLLLKQLKSLKYKDWDQNLKGIQIKK